MDQVNTTQRRPPPGTGLDTHPRLGILARCADCWPCCATRPPTSRRRSSTRFPVPHISCVTAVPTSRAHGPTTHVVLGFNRLSIIDIAHSHQPLRWGPPESPDRYVLVFNGEIYNYLELREALRSEFGAVFATDGDSEAIIAAYHHWGIDALTRLRGMFAFALWDTVERELFCARDPFGIKPLFMATGPGGTAVGSEKKCLLELAGHRRYRYRASTIAPCSTTRCCSTCQNRRPCTAACAGWNRAAMPACGPASRTGGDPLLHPAVRRRCRSPPAASRRATTRSPRCSRIRSPSTCAPTSRSAPSCPAASTRPRSPRWPCGTTRG